MCGIAGFVGVTDPTLRLELVNALGVGIDSRGGHAVGFVSVSGARVRCERALGEWSDSSERFRMLAATGDTVLLHSRYATHNNAHDVTCAHPFAIKRPGATRPKTVLWGVHNGSSGDARLSARAHARDFTVDSLEILHLLADGEYDTLQALTGWGTLAWITADDKGTIRLARLTDDGDLYVCRTVCGAVVFGSTRDIVEEALESVGMVAALYYTPLTAGTVYAVRAEGLAVSPAHPQVRFSEPMWSKRGTDPYRSVESLGPDVAREGWRLRNRTIWDNEAYENDLENDRRNKATLQDEEDGFDLAAFNRWWTEHSDADDEGDGA